jgi:glycosyltransferase involved in cell wall biosynthesis
MKIAVLSSFPPRKCGIAYLTENLFDAFRAQGHELVTFGIEDSHSDYPADTDSIFGLLKVADHIKRLKIQHVTVQYIIGFYRKKYLGLNFLLFLIALRHQRVIVTLHEAHRIRSLKQIFKSPGDVVQILIQAAIARLSSGVILLTEAQEDNMKHYGATNTRCVYLGILPREIPRTRTVFNRALFFGKLQPAKGAHLFPEIARACPGIHFTMACSVEPQHTAYRDAIARAVEGIPNITFVCRDWIGDEEKTAYFAEADILVLPYIDTYYQSGVASESGVYNIPVVVPRMGPLSEITLKFRNGETFEEPTPQNVKTAIETVFRNYPKYLDGIRAYRHEANWHAISEKYLAFLRG